MALLASPPTVRPSAPCDRRSLCAESSLFDENLASPTVSGGDRRTGVSGGPGGVGVQGERHVVAQRESYIRRALDTVVPRPAQNVYRCGWFFRGREWSGLRLSRCGLRHNPTVGFGASYPRDKTFSLDTPETWGSILCRRSFIGPFEMARSLALWSDLPDDSDGLESVRELCHELVENK